MTGDAEPPERQSPTERRLDDHLALLRAAPPPPSGGLPDRVLRTARWQRAARVPLRAAAMIAGAMLDGLGRLVGGSGRGRRQ